MPQLASVNGRVTKVDEACIPIKDRGFLFGDAAYEVVRVYAGQPFMLREHLARLMDTLAGMRFANPPTMETLENECLRMVALSELQEAALFLHISRGSDGQGRFLADFTRCNVVIRCEDPPAWPDHYYSKGVKLITVEDQRWLRGDLKTVNLLPRILAFEHAFQADAAEALWVDPDGFVREGLSCNVFAWRSGTLTTPPLTGRILPGITRSAVLTLARRAGLTVAEARIPLTSLLNADEAFICSTTREIVPVVQVDEHPIGHGRPGSLTLDLYSHYKALVGEVD